MPAFRPMTELETHAVENQPPERGDLDLWAGDLALREAAARAGARERAAALAAFGAAAGSEEMRAAGRLANRHPPELRLFDRGGRRLDEVAFHPAYHALMRFGIEAGYPSIAWKGGAGGHVAHAAMVYMLSQVEPGVCCPMTMTYAAVPALAADPALAAAWVPRVLAARYDPAARPAAEKAGATIGMAMTEKQGGSDVRANTTRAEPDGEGWRLVGHKWFCSAPMSDAFLTLAQAPAGLTCFLVPRWTPDGERNAIRLMRLKDKLGNRANASAEIEYAGAFALRAGRAGRRRAHHHRDGAPHPPRHRAGAGRADAGGALGGALVGERAAGLPAAADRAAADGERAGRPRARGGERAGARAAGGAGLRRGGPRLRPGGGGAGQVPQQQALPGHDLRGDGVPGRDGLCRGRAAAAALPRGAA